MRSRSGVHTAAGKVAARLVLPQLDAIRVAAMLAIFLHHLWNGVVSSPAGALQESCDFFFDAFAHAVVVFNLISGFVLALPYLGPEGRPAPAYSVFFRRRVLRIIPPYYLAILGFALANALIFDVDALSALTHFIQQLLFLQSLDYGLLSSNLAALWYLGLLMQFYLVFPWVLDLFRRLGAWQASLLILAVCWGGTGLLSFYLSVHPHSPLGMTGYMIHFNLPARLPEFALGMWMAASWRSRARVGRERPLAAPFTWFLLTMAAFALLGAPFAKETDLLPFSLYPVAVCLTLFVALFLWPLVSRLGHCRLVARMSAASYSIYILHQPTFSYLGVVPGNHTGSIATFTLLALVFLPICYLLATALDRLSGLVMEIASAKPQRPTEPGICAAEPCRPDASEES